MAHSRRSTKVPNIAGREQGERSNRYNGTYIGVVKDNRDVAKNGRLKVWISEMSSQSEDASSWILVQYASPFAGSTPFKSSGNDIKDYTQSQTAYGLWMVPPDVDAEVLVTFINGDPTKGIWFACLYNNFMNQMLPGDGVVEEGLHYGKDVSGDAIPLPVGEYNRSKVDARTFKSPDTEKKPVNVYKAAAATNQGLIFDDVRGPNNSSARRESPSNVYGLLTPGPLDDSTQDTLPYRSNVNAGPQSKGHRMGGSSLVFDDSPTSEHITFKTRSGAQVKIDQSNGMIYINNRDGTAWLELSPDGHVDIYAAGSISMRAEKDLNIRADRDVNIEAGRNMNLRAAKDYVSTDDVVELLSSYANTQQKTIASLFTEAQKKDYIKDFPDVQHEYIQGRLTIDKAFATALLEAGFNIRAVSPSLKFTPEQEEAARTSLTSVDLMHLIRGSHVVGQAFGTGGNISAYAFNDMSSIARNEMRMSTYDNSIQMLSGKKLNLTAGTEASVVSGTQMYVSAGTGLDLLSGSDFKHLIGGQYSLNVLNDWSMTVRGNMNIRHEGLEVNFEGIPTEFTENGREESSETHSIQIKAGTLESQYDSVALKVDGEYTAESESFTNKVNGDHSVESDSFNVKANGTYAVDADSVTVKSGGSITSEAASSHTLHGATTNVYGIAQVNIKAPDVDSDETAAPGQSLGSLSSVDGVDDVDPATQQVARPTIGESALFAVTYDVLYAKSNVLPLLCRDGNKEYAITYYRQEVESIVRRFVTHEPCIEHTITGGSELRLPLYQTHLKFRILD